MEAKVVTPINSDTGLVRRASLRAVSIDVHHHFNPTLKDNEGNHWCVQKALEELDRNAISTAIASLGPVSDSGSAQRPRRVRDWNEWGTKTCLDHPGRFGLFASLPLPNIDLALAEIAYAYDVLHADGIGISTNEEDTWLGDERNGPIFAELNRRNAVVFVHPAPTSRCAAISQEYGGDAISSPWIEFPMNTARAILGVLIKGVTRTYPNIRFIFSHGGGAMPFLLARIAGFTEWRTVGSERLKVLFPEGVYAEFGKLYFECAQAYAPETMDLLRRVVPPSHLLFGSDFSYFPIAHSREAFSSLQVDADTKKGIGGGNAAALFPRFKDSTS